MHIKAEGMTKFDIFHVFVEISVNSELCFFWALLKPAKIWNSSQNRPVQKCPCLSSLTNKFQWTREMFWPLIRRILIWIFWNYKSSWSKKSTPTQPVGVIGAKSPPTIYLKIMQFLGASHPFLQRFLGGQMLMFADISEWAGVTKCWRQQTFILNEKMCHLLKVLNFDKKFSKNLMSYSRLVWKSADKVG